MNVNPVTLYNASDYRTNGLYRSPKPNSTVRPIHNAQNSLDTFPRNFP